MVSRAQTSIFFSLKLYSYFLPSVLVSPLRARLPLSFSPGLRTLERRLREAPTAGAAASAAAARTSEKGSRHPTVVTSAKERTTAETSAPAPSTRRSSKQMPARQPLAVGRPPITNPAREKSQRPSSLARERVAEKQLTPPKITPLKPAHPAQSASSQPVVAAQKSACAPFQRPSSVLPAASPIEGSPPAPRSLTMSRGMSLVDDGVPFRGYPELAPSPAQKASKAVEERHPLPAAPSSATGVQDQEGIVKQHPTPAERPRAIGRADHAAVDSKETRRSFRSSGPAVPRVSSGGGCSTGSPVVREGRDAAVAHTRRIEELLKQGKDVKCRKPECAENVPRPTVSRESQPLVVVGGKEPNRTGRKMSGPHRNNSTSGARSSRVGRGCEGVSASAGASRESQQKGIGESTAAPREKPPVQETSQGGTKTGRLVAGGSLAATRADWVAGLSTRPAATARPGPAMGASRILPVDKAELDALAADISLTQPPSRARLIARFILSSVMEKSRLRCMQRVPSMTDETRARLLELRASRVYRQQQALFDLMEASMATMRQEDAPFHSGQSVGAKEGRGATTVGAGSVGASARRARSVGVTESRAATSTGAGAVARRDPASSAVPLTPGRSSPRVELFPPGGTAAGQTEEQEFSSSFDSVRARCGGSDEEEKQEEPSSVHKSRPTGSCVDAARSRPQRLRHRRTRRAATTHKPSAPPKSEVVDPHGCSGAGGTGSDDEFKSEMDALIPKISLTQPVAWAPQIASLVLGMRKGKEWLKVRGLGGERARRSITIAEEAREIVEQEGDKLRALVREAKTSPKKDALTRSKDERKHGEHAIRQRAAGTSNEGKRAKSQRRRRENASICRSSTAAGDNTNANTYLNGQRSPGVNSSLIRDERKPGVSIVVGGRGRKENAPPAVVAMVAAVEPQPLEAVAQEQNLATTLPTHAVVAAHPVVLYRTCEDADVRESGEESGKEEHSTNEDTVGRTSGANRSAEEGIAKIGKQSFQQTSFSWIDSDSEDDRSVSVALDDAEEQAQELEAASTAGTAAAAQTLIQTLSVGNVERTVSRGMVDGHGDGAAEGMGGCFVWQAPTALLLAARPEVCDIYSDSESSSLVGTASDIDSSNNSLQLSSRDHHHGAASFVVKSVPTPTVTGNAGETAQVDGSELSHYGLGGKDGGLTGKYEDGEEIRIKSGDTCSQVDSREGNTRVDVGRGWGGALTREQQGDGGIMRASGDENSWKADTRAHNTRIDWAAELEILDRNREKNLRFLRKWKAENGYDAGEPWLEGDGETEKTVRSGGRTVRARQPSVCTILKRDEDGADLVRELLSFLPVRAYVFKCRRLVYMMTSGVPSQVSSAMKISKTFFMPPTSFYLTHFDDFVCLLYTLNLLNDSLIFTQYVEKDVQNHRAYFPLPVIFCRTPYPLVLLSSQAAREQPVPGTDSGSEMLATSTANPLRTLDDHRRHERDRAAASTFRHPSTMHSDDGRAGVMTPVLPQRDDVVDTVTATPPQPTTENQASPGRRQQGGGVIGLPLAGIDSVDKVTGAAREVVVNVAGEEEGGVRSMTSSVLVPASCVEGNKGSGGNAALGAAGEDGDGVPGERKQKSGVLAEVNAGDADVPRQGASAAVFEVERSSWEGGGRDKRNWSAVPMVSPRKAGVSGYVGEFYCVLFPLFLMILLARASLFITVGTDKYCL